MTPQLSTNISTPQKFMLRNLGIQEFTYKISLAIQAQASASASAW
jgi:hypothetical protein